MKILKLIFLLVFCTQLSANSQTLREQLWKVYESTDLFQLEDDYARLNKKTLAPVLKTMYEYSFAVLLRRDDRALDLTDELLENYSDNLDSLLKGQLIRVKARILSWNWHYGKAADYVRDHLHLVKDHNDSVVLIQRAKDYNRMREIPAAEIHRPAKGCSVNYTLQSTPKGHHYIVPVEINGKNMGFLFDICSTSTGISITEKMMKEMGIQILGKTNVYGGSGTTTCLNGIIDSIKVGDIVFKHIFSNINIVQDSSKVSAVLGNDFMHMVGSFSIYPKKQKIVFPKKTRSFYKQHNMMFGGGLYFINVKSKKERAVFTLDSGANATLLLAPYYAKHKEWIDLHGQRDSSSIDEGGRKRVEKFLIVPSFPVTVGKKTVNINKAYAFTNMRWDAFGEQQGVLGTSFFDCFSKVTVNFDAMNVSVYK
jgi:predicted aspartyl protease